MPEKTETKVYRPVEPSTDLYEHIPSDKRGFTSTQDKANERKFYGYYLIPDTEEEAQERYKCNLRTLIDAGITNKIYSLKFKDLIESMNERGAGEQEIADAVQAMVDSMTCEPKARKATKKADPVTVKKAQEFDEITAIAKEAGFDTPAEYIAFLKSKKAKK